MFDRVLARLRCELLHRWLLWWWEIDIDDTPHARCTACHLRRR